MVGALKAFRLIKVRDGANKIFDRAMDSGEMITSP